MSMPMHQTSSHSCGAPIPNASARSAVPPSQRRSRPSLWTTRESVPRVAALDEERYGRSLEARDLKRLVWELGSLRTGLLVRQRGSLNTGYYSSHDHPPVG